jgi:hypothetical protein
VLPSGLPNQGLGIVGVFYSALVLRWMGRLLGSRASSIAMRAQSSVASIAALAITVVATAGLWSIWAAPMDDGALDRDFGRRRLAAVWLVHTMRLNIAA